MDYSKYDQIVYGYCMILYDIVVIPTMSRVMYGYVIYVDSTILQNNWGANDQPWAKGMEFLMSPLQWWEVSEAFLTQPAPVTPVIRELRRSGSNESLTWLQL